MKYIKHINEEFINDSPITNDYKLFIDKTKIFLDKFLKEKGINNPNYQGGFCFHFGILLFSELKNKYPKRELEIIADGGHLAVHDYTSNINDFSLDSDGIHKYEWALRERPQRRWKNIISAINAIKKGWASTEQIKTLEELEELIKNNKNSILV